jgi:hypothetical protein
MQAYYEFEVSLSHIEPRIWRRFEIAVSASFAMLHKAIQDSLGWEDSHVWEFRRPGRGVLAGVPDDNFGSFDTEEIPDAQEVKLSQYFKADGGLESCDYNYDFGDDWSHLVKLIQIVSRGERFGRRLLAGKRACPPEDCGGVHGYERLLEFAETGEDRNGGDPAGLAEWLGDWKPDVFDLHVVKAAFDQ